jgi:hypothetical protein
LNIPIATAPNGASEVGNTVTITTTVPHNFAVGQTVVVAGVGAAGYNGDFTITGVSGNTFTYTSGSTLGYRACASGAAPRLPDRYASRGYWEPRSSPLRGADRLVRRTNRPGSEDAHFVGFPLGGRKASEWRFTLRGDAPGGGALARSLSRHTWKLDFTPIRSSIR